MDKIYLIQAVFNGTPFFYEIDVKNTTLEIITKDIIEGQYDVGPMDRVIEIDLEAGTAKDASELVAESVSQYSWRRDYEPASEAKAFLGRFGYDYYVTPEYPEDRPRAWRIPVYDAYPA